MGYYVKIIDSDFKIPAKSFSELEEKFRKLNTYDALKSGGSFGNGKKTESWFSWMNNWDDTCSAKETFIELGFEVDELPDGSLSLTGYDSKQGQEELFLMVTAPYVSVGSYINYLGEDGDTFSYEVIGGVLCSDGIPCVETNYYIQKLAIKVLEV